IKGAGVPVVVAESFARIFYRNAINIGLPVLEARGLKGGIATGDVVEVDLVRGEVVNRTSGKRFAATPLTDKAVEILEAGGLVNIVRRKLGASGSGGRKHEVQNLPAHANHKED
ncbi:MAG TPA: hypothetical protein VM681_09925, partial [Candidatus Thermoplasmatota archaeon]|nr:hypothetical protein [Candidatus Thermoplasmatota archaeon]